MTIEVKNLESDFHYVKDECKEEKDAAGDELRVFGRRFVDLIDEVVPQKLTSKVLASLQLEAKEAAAARAAAASSAAGKATTAVTSTIVDKDNVNQQNVTIRIPTVTL